MTTIVQALDVLFDGDPQYCDTVSVADLRPEIAVDIGALKCYSNAASVIVHRDDADCQAIPTASGVG